MIETPSGPESAEHTTDAAVMSRDDVLDVVREAIVRIAPDADVAGLATDVDYRDEVDLDSMDFLALLTALERRTGVNIPEIDYADIGTLDQLVDYLTARGAAAPATG